MLFSLFYYYCCSGYETTFITMFSHRGFVTRLFSISLSWMYKKNDVAKIYDCINMFSVLSINLFDKSNETTQHRQRHRHRVQLCSCTFCCWKSYQFQRLMISPEAIELVRISIQNTASTQFYVASLCLCILNRFKILREKKKEIKASKMWFFFLDVAVSRTSPLYRKERMNDVNKMNESACKQHIWFPSTVFSNSNISIDIGDNI